MLDFDTLQQRYSEASIAIKNALKQLKDYQQIPDQDIFLDLYSNYLSKRAVFIEVEREYKLALNT